MLSGIDSTSAFIQLWMPGPTRTGPDKQTMVKGHGKWPGPSWQALPVALIQTGWQGSGWPELQHRLVWRLQTHEYDQES